MPERSGHTEIDADREIKQADGKDQLTDQAKKRRQLGRSFINARLEERINDHRQDVVPRRPRVPALGVKIPWQSPAACGVGNILLRRSSYGFCADRVVDTPSRYPRATSSIIIKLKPTAKDTVPMFECFPCDISGINSSTTT